MRSHAHASLGAPPAPPRPRSVIEQQQPAALGELLGALLSAHETVAALQLPALGSVLEGLEELATDVASAWRDAAGTADATELVVRHSSLPDAVLQALSSEAGQAPPAVAQASRQRREDLAAAMEEARDVLRYWARRCAEQGPR